jgi:hypothetical protein
MRRLFACVAVICGIAASPPVVASGLQTVPTERWGRGAVERVLHLFAYGGRVTEGQIRRWVALGPTAAIEQMLTLDSYNPYLAPRHDGINNYTQSLESLRSLFNSQSANNPMNPLRRRDYDTFQQSGGEAWYSKYAVQHTWLAAAHLRGGNPFRHKVGFWLTNHLMATSIPYTVIHLIRDHYDTAMRQLASGSPFWQVLAEGAASAAITKEYGHSGATFNNNTGIFVGSDDFAREFHKLFFKIGGETDGIEYHEQVTIKNTALLLTGMGIDKELPPPGIPVISWQLLKSPIDFTDHTDAEGNRINNQSSHHQAPLEILHTTIDGINAKEKLYDLASVAALHPESLANLPIEIVGFFGDDNLSSDKIAQIRQTWADLVGQRHDFLLFLRRYAISTAFHNSTTYKYTTAFDQEIIPWNISTADNLEFYLANTASPASINLANNFVEPFYPIFRIFGHQTGLVAANDTGLFRRTYNTAVASGGPYVLPVYCDERQGSTQRDWRTIVPADRTGRYVVWRVGRWLWSRLTGDSGANFTKLERAHLAAILARGTDLATVIDPTRPDAVYTAADLEQPALASLITSLETSILSLADGDASARLDANSRVSLAVSFIRATPFAFAVEGR